jgi:3-methyladenine DNA glycosylase AlkD
MLLDEIFDTADRLLMDDDDLVRKGYGWMLKEASNRFPDRVFAYVIMNKGVMPRTALRYAIEKLPHHRRREAMKK